MKKLLIINLLLILSQVSIASDEREQASCKPSVKIGLLGAVLGLSGLMLTASAITENSYTIENSHNSNGDTCNTPELRTDKNVMGAFGMYLLFSSGIAICHAYHLNTSEEKEDEERSVRHNESQVNVIDQENEESQFLVFNENTDITQNSEVRSLLHLNQRLLQENQDDLV